MTMATNDTTAAHALEKCASAMIDLSAEDKERVISALNVFYLPPKPSAIAEAMPVIVAMLPLAQKYLDSMLAPRGPVDSTDPADPHAEWVHDAMAFIGRLSSVQIDTIRTVLTAEQAAELDKLMPTLGGFGGGQ